MGNYTSRTRWQGTAFGEVDCTIDLAADPGASRNVIAAWKDSVPFRHRSYDASTKVWRFAPPYQGLAIELLVAHLPNAEVPRCARSQPTTRAPREVRGPFSVLHLAPTASPELIEDSYRLLARMHHPDRGGSTEVMQQINGAYATLRELVGA